MASKRAKRRRSCTSKVKHASRDFAIIALKRMKNFKLHPYKCNFCGGWHTGHPPRNVVQGIAARAENPRTMKRLGD